MGIRERKARHKNQLREQILSVAEELFVTEGYRNVSMRKIAQRIEYSPTTIYRLFENKTEIMNRLIADGYRGVYECYDRVLEERGDSPVETLGQIIRAYARFAMDHPNHYELWFSSGELDVSDGRLRMRHGEASYPVYQTWLDLIEECRAAGAFAKGRGTLELFQLIWGSVHGLISVRIRHPRFHWPPVAGHVDALLAVLLPGLRREPETT